jgi:DNA mismatch endonuclease (patch repair protein)
VDPPFLGIPGRGWLVHLAYMADVFDPATRSRVMATVRNAYTTPEMILAELLERSGVRARPQAKELPGSPDLVLDSVRVAVFVDGDFWHGRQWFERRVAPVQNRDFWINKFTVNRNRDRAADARLRRAGWSVVRLWASDIKRDPAGAVAVVQRRIRLRGRAISRFLQASQKECDGATSVRPLELRTHIRSRRRHPR